MNLFDILAFEESTINSLNSAFSMSGRIYGMMLRTARNSSVTMFNDTIQGVVNNFYVIAAVFMLFRIAISVFQYIIEPDKMTDSKVGAGKMLVNVVLTVILLIAFYPADRGQFSVYRILNKVEEVVLFQGVDPETGKLKEGSQGGIIDRIFNNVSVDNKCDGSTITAFNDTNKGNSFNSQIAFSNFENKLFIENVNAAAKTKKCYFNGDQYQLLSDAEKKRLESAGITKDNVGEKTTGIVFELKDKKFNKIKETKGFKSSSTSSGLTMSKNAKKQSDCENLLLAQEINQRNGISSSRIISKSGDKINDGTVTIKMKNTEEDATKSAEDGTNTDTKRGQADAIAKHGLTEAEGNFANSVAGSFYYCVSEDDTDREKAYCDSIESNESPSNPSCLDFEYRPLYINSAGSEGKKLYKDGKLDYYFIVGILSSLVVSALLIWLCVDVIVRNLKLMLFQIIAPIPLINGIDPNDQMRKKWFKAYFGAYLDLFIKIFSIKLLTVLFPIVGQQMTNSSAIEKIFFIFALLTFVKIAPDLISKILGIDGLSGAGKNALDMAKKGLGVGTKLGFAGAGWIAGTAVGGATGGLLGALRGGLRGAGSGWKKDVFGGARSIADENYKIQDLKDQGVKLPGRIAERFRGMTGVKSAYQLKNEELDNRQKAVDDKKNANRQIEFENSRTKELYDLDKAIKDSGKNDLDLNKPQYRGLVEVAQYMEIKRLLSAKEASGKSLTEQEQSLLADATKNAQDSISEFNIISAMRKDGSTVTRTAKSLQYSVDNDGNITDINIGKDGKVVTDKTDNTITTKQDNAVTSKIEQRNKILESNPNIAINVEKEFGVEGFKLETITASNSIGYKIGDTKDALEKRSGTLNTQITNIEKSLQDEAEEIAAERRENENNKNKLIHETYYKR